MTPRPIPRLTTPRIHLTRRRRPARILSVCGLLLCGSCAWPSPERQLLLDFFHACRVYDVTVLERLSAVPCNPKTDGIVHQFELLGVEEVSPTARRVSIQASGSFFDGAAFDRPMTITVSERDGRWMVTGITPLPASQTSPAASSPPPN